MIAALAKAEALDRHLYGAGARELVAVTLSDREAWEFLAWYETESIRYAPPEYRLAFEHDLAQARAYGSPWPMLVTVQIAGYHLMRLPDEVH